MATRAISFDAINFNTEVAVGIKIPFLKKNGSLFDQSYSTEDQLLTNLKNLILTRPGERVMQPQFGTYLREALFDPNTDRVAQTLEDNIRFAIGYWLPYVQIVNLEVENVIVTGPNVNDEHGCRVTLTVRVSSKLSELPVSFIVTPSVIELL